MHIYLTEQEITFSLDERDIKIGFDSDIPTFLDVVRAYPAPMADMFLSIFETITSIDVAHADMNIFSAKDPDDEEEHVIAIFSSMKTEEGHLIASKQNLVAEVNEEVLSELADACGIKIAIIGEEDDEYYDSELDGDLEIYDDNIPETSIDMEETLTAWHLTRDNEEDNEKNIKNIVRRHLKRNINNNQDDLFSEKTKKPSPKKETKRQDKTKIIRSYKFINSDAFIKAFDSTGLLYTNFDHTYRLFKPRGKKNEIYLTVSYPDKKALKKGNNQLLEFADAVEIPRGEPIYPTSTNPARTKKCSTETKSSSQTNKNKTFLEKNP